MLDLDLRCPDLHITGHYPCGLKGDASGLNMHNFS